MNPSLTFPFLTRTLILSHSNHIEGIGNLEIKLLKLSNFEKNQCESSCRKVCGCGKINFFYPDLLTTDILFHTKANDQEY